ncbi:M15 family metallopeptidase [Humibacter albus]|uniref:M15 family metallopeptidase n=1 Tax=Humibacter albus TaxID=427754 RepID=UPI000524B21D|nr:M15 family metallopeptidase [Humibacter albus]
MASHRARVGALVAALTAGVLVLGSGAWALGAAVFPHEDAASARSGIAVRPSPTASPAPVAVAVQTPSPTPTPTFDKAANSIDDPRSIWVVVNKSRALNPVDYVPPDLVQPPVPNINGQPVRQIVSGPLATMFAAAKSEAGLSLTLQSGYRSYQTQVSVYDQDVAANGQAYADTDTARPGHSEHQTGLSVDISAASGECTLNACFGQTAEGRWLAANAWRFGFLLRYPSDKVPVTGFTYEPWHFRYIGLPLATELHDTGVTTLEEYFGVPGGETYPG